MKTIRRQWYNIGLVVAIITLAYLAVFWNGIQIIQKLLFLNFVTILLHQFEEYGFPGGEPAIMNIALRKSDIPNRFPLNQNSAMIINVLIAYTVYLIPVFFPQLIWLGLAPIFFGFFQFIVHGIMTNKVLKTFYNPGLASVIFGHIPIGIYYIYEITSKHLVTTSDWVIGIIYTVATVYITFLKMTYTWLADRNSPYVFDEVEMKRFHVKEKLDKIATNL